MNEQLAANEFELKYGNVDFRPFKFVNASAPPSEAKSISDL